MSMCESAYDVAFHSNTRSKQQLENTHQCLTACGECGNGVMATATVTTSNYDAAMSPPWDWDLQLKMLGAPSGLAIGSPLGTSLHFVVERELLGSAERVLMSTVLPQPYVSTLHDDIIAQSTLIASLTTLLEVTVTDLRNITLQEGVVVYRNVKQDTARSRGGTWRAVQSTLTFDAEIEYLSVYVVGMVCPIMQIVQSLHTNKGPLPYEGFVKII